MEWQSIVKQYYHKLLTVFSECDLCGNSTQQYPLICSACLNDLPIFKQALIQGDLLNWPMINRALPKVRFDQLFCLSPYLPPFNQWLAEFKYRGRYELSTIFADLLAQQWRASESFKATPPIDLVLSVPLHADKWKLRGYNQAHLIAQGFAQKSQLVYQATALKRVHKQNSQVGQTGAQRRKNLKNSFALTQVLADHIKHVALIDDVVTTGSTASEISLLLKNSGVDKVTVIALCLSLPKR